MNSKDVPPPNPLDGSTLAGRKSARARAGRSGPPGTPTSSAPRSAASTAEAPAEGESSSLPSEAALAHVLLGDEQARAHAFSGVITFLAASVLLALPAVASDRDVKAVVAAAFAITCASSFWVWRATASDRVYPRRLLRAYMWLIALSVLFIEYFAGVFSGVIAIVTLGIYHLAQSADPMQSLVAPIVSIVGFVVLAALVGTGVLPDRGLIPSTHATPSALVFSTMAGAGVLAFTAYLARKARASMRDAIERSNEAMLAAQRGAALLAEAQQHLERALGVAVGKAGHYTGQVAGPYRLDVIIGIGAMGEIYAANHVETGARAAIKLLQSRTQQRPDLVERFLREGEICRNLDSPHLVRVHGVGRLDDGAPYMAMELLEGSDLAAVLRKEDSLPLDDVVELARALGEGLAHAHEAGVIHRDLKPVNVFQSHDDLGRRRWKILDFGISKLRDGSGTLTDIAIVGTPGYMSPEQARGAAVDPRSDIFSMAAVLYRALTGRPAFTGPDTPQIMFEVVYRTPERPSSIVKSLPAEIDLVLAIAFAKQREERFQTAREFARTFELAARGHLAPELKVRARAIVDRHPWGELVPSARE